MLRASALALLAWLTWFAKTAEAQTDRESAEVVLVGPTQTSVALRQVITELLQREGVEPLFLVAEHFAAEVLLAAPDGDARVHVFVTLPTPLLAKLYLRGPHGIRFILRELSLRSGMDELGCESIALVVATSSHALLHSSEGVDRETARANLAREQQVPPATEAAPASPVSAPAPVASDHERSGTFEISARLNGGFSGDALGERLGAGLELGLGQRQKRHLFVRERLVFEQFLAQALQTAELATNVRTSTLLLGVDVGTVLGPQAFLLGLSCGVDLMHIAPEKTGDSSWKVAKARVDAVPVLRGELRYERTFGKLLWGLAAYADTALIANHFEVRDGTQVRRLASPWRVTPGLALSLGWQAR